MTRLRTATLAAMLLVFVAPATAPAADPSGPYVGSSPELHLAPISPTFRHKAKKKPVARPATVIEQAQTPAPAPSPAPAAPAATGAAPATTHLTAAPPEEFAELLEPQKTVVDVYYGGEFLTTTLAKYTPDNIEFLQPEEIVSRIPNVVSRLALLNHLSGEIPRNSDLSCAPIMHEGCGKLEPEFIGVIFDESRFRADVFVHPDMLMVAPQQSVSRYLAPPTDRSLTAVQNLSAVYAEDTAGNTEYNIAGLTWLAQGMQRVYSNWTQSESTGFSVEQLAWQGDTRDHEYTAGLFSSRGDAFSFVRSEYLEGAGFERSLRTRTDLDTMAGTEISLFLPTRSQVDIYRDGLLLASRLYPAGNQILDTSRLPTGAYDIEIRITDTAGETRTMRRFYSKSNRIAPKGIPLYHLEAGEVVHPTREDSFPVDQHAWQARGGYQYRYSDALGLGAGGAATDTHAAVEASAVWMNPMIETSAQTVLSTQGDYGWGAQISGRYGRLSGTVWGRRLWPHFRPGETTDYQLLGNEISQAYASVSYPVFAGLVQATADTSRDNTGHSEVYSLRYTIPWVLFGFRSGSISAELTMDNGDLTVMAGIQAANFGPHLRYGGDLRGGSETVDGDTHGASPGGAFVGWNDGDRWAADVDASLRATVERDARALTAEGLDASRYGRLDAALEQVDSDTTGSGHRASATFDTNIVANNKGVSWGGQQLAPSAVVLDIRGRPGALFDVYVDGSRNSSAIAGRRNVILLSPYHSYDVSIVDRGTTYVSYDQKARRVTLYPGTVQTLAWQVDVVTVAVGRIILQQNVCSLTDETCYDVHAPLRNAVISGTSGFAMTDEDGWFQVEMTSGTKQIHAKRRDIECNIDIGQPVMVNGIAKLGDLTCVAAPIRAPEADGEGASPSSKSNDPIGGKRLGQVKDD